MALHPCQLERWIQLEMLLIPNALCWSFRKCNCACALPAEVQLRLRVTRRSWQKLFADKNFVKILVTAQTQLRSYSEQQRAFGNSNICNCSNFWITGFVSFECSHVTNIDQIGVSEASKCSGINDFSYCVTFLYLRLTNLNKKGYQTMSHNFLVVLYFVDLVKCIYNFSI